MMQNFQHRVGRALLSGLVAAVALGATCFAADTDLEWQRRLDAELKKLDDNYAEVRHELEEEYAAIARQRDEANRDIYTRIQAVRDRVVGARADVDRELGKAREALTAANISPNSPEYQRVIDGIDGTMSEKVLAGTDGTMDGTMADGIDYVNDDHGRSLVGLQRSYQLNTKRFGELERILQAREAVEERYHQARRDLVRDRMNVEAARRNDLTDEAKRELAVRETAVKEMEKRAKTRYDNAMDALEEYEDLVQSRIRSQKKYLDEQDGILNSLIDGNLTPDRRNDLTRRLSVLEAKRSAEERRYQNDLKYIEEKYTYERQRNREIARLDNERRDIENAWARAEDSLESGIRDLDARIRDASGDAKRDLEAQRKVLADRRDAEKKAYKDAIKNVEQRDKILERSMKNRLAYLKDRNKLRIRMAEDNLDSRRMDRLRNELARLEDKRVEEEQMLNNEYASLTAALPAAYANSAWKRGDIDVRRTRVASKVENMADRLENRWKTHEAELRQDIETRKARLSANIDAAERERLEREQREAQERYDAAKRRYENAKSSISQRLDAEKKRMDARAEYRQQRQAMRKAAAADSSAALTDNDRRLRDLNNAMEKHEEAYRRSLDNAESVIPAPSVRPTWQERADRRADRVADAVRETGVRRGVDNDGRVIVDDGESFADDVRSAYDRVRDAIVDTYHEVVDYITD